jgi:hypothetical protein
MKSKAKAMFRVVEVRPDGAPVLIVRQSTLDGAALVKRLIQRDSPFSELRIEYGPSSEMGHGQYSAVDQSRE